MRFAFSAGLILFLAACSSKLPEATYYQQAKKTYTAQKFDQAVENYKALVEHYPESKHRAESLFLLGYINANDIKDYDEAKKYYEQFINEYPKHELITSARYELENLGKDVNEIPFLKNISSDSSQAAVQEH